VFVEVSTAGRVGFEPTRRLRVLRFSRPVQSTTLPPAQAIGADVASPMSEKSHRSREIASGARRRGANTPVVRRALVPRNHGENAHKSL
jgi:hypothetical protein